MHLSTLRRYPVKSCRGQALDTAVVEPWGLAGDRRWMIVDRDGALVTAREHPRLVLVEPSLDPSGGLTFRYHGTDRELPPLTVPLPDPSRQLSVRVWKNELTAAPADDDASAWFSALLDEPAGLVQLDDPTRRPVDPVFGTADDRVSFADGYPLLLTSSSSLTALNDWIAEGPNEPEGPLPMLRFRPNVVVDGAPAWAEDGWRRVRIGDAVFRAVKGCARCVLTLVDPWTAAKGREPIATLARYRRWDGGTWFGMNLIPDTPGAELRLGDDVEVIESVIAPDGPPR